MKGATHVMRQTRWLFKAPTMIMGTFPPLPSSLHLLTGPIITGADTSHPGPGQTDQPTIAAPPPANGDTANSANGASHHADDKRDAQQSSEAENNERLGSTAPEGTSSPATKQDASQRGEKQIKVLVESYFLTAVTPVFPP